VKIGPADPEILWLGANKSDNKKKLVAMATSLEILKKNSDLSSTPTTLSYGVKITKIARGLRFAYNTKFVAMATSLEESEKNGLDQEIHATTFYLVKRS